MRFVFRDSTSHSAPRCSCSVVPSVADLGFWLSCIMQLKEQQSHLLMWWEIVTQSMVCLYFHFSVFGESMFEHQKLWSVDSRVKHQLLKGRMFKPQSGKKYLLCLTAIVVLIEDTDKHVSSPAAPLRQSSGCVCLCVVSTFLFGCFIIYIYRNCVCEWWHYMRMF